MKHRRQKCFDLYHHHFTTEQKKVYHGGQSKNRETWALTKTLPNIVNQIQKQKAGGKSWLIGKDVRHATASIVTWDKQVKYVATICGKVKLSTT
jgi:flagellar hook assembly protein FlgD